MSPEDRDALGRQFLEASMTDVLVGLVVGHTVLRTRMQFMRGRPHFAVDEAKKIDDRDLKRVLELFADDSWLKCPGGKEFLNALHAEALTRGIEQGSGDA